MEYTFTYTGHADINTLPDSDLKLVTEARHAADTAYAPYSGFSVGAAAALDDGRIMTASNQENASYPEGQCAERVLINYIKANHPNAKILAIALAAKRDGILSGNEVYPCGGCRQVLAEAERRQDLKIRVITTSSSSYSEIFSASDLLPLAFKM